MKQFKVTITAWYGANDENEALQYLVKNIDKHVKDYKAYPGVVKIEEVTV